MKTVEESYKEFTEYLKGKSKSDKQLRENLSNVLSEMQIFNFSPITEDFRTLWENSGYTSLTQVDVLTISKYFGSINVVKTNNSVLHVNRPFVVPYNYVYVCTERSNTYSFLAFRCIDDKTWKLYFSNVVGNTTELDIKVADDGESFSIDTNPYIESLYDVFKKNTRNYAKVKALEEIQQKVLSSVDTLMSEVLFNMRTFERLQDGNSKEFKCFAEKPTNPERVIYIKDVYNKRTVKVPQYKTVIIVIDSKCPNETAKKYASNCRKQLEYTCSWIVRGHYRNLHNPDSYGVNRLGKRVLLGKTWIESYQKGDLSLPMRKTEKIVVQGTP